MCYPIKGESPQRCYKRWKEIPLRGIRKNPEEWDDTYSCCSNNRFGLLFFNES